MSTHPAHLHPVTRDGPGVDDLAAPDKVTAGSGVARLWNAFSGPSGRFHAGHWQSEPGTRRVRYTETELCVLIAGRVRLTDLSGASAVFGPGDAFVIAAGFEGSWQSIGQVTKIYAILEPPA